MNAQNIVVGLIVLFAVLYVSKIALQKIKSFSPKSGVCASDCGCGDSKAGANGSFVKIQKS